MSSGLTHGYGAPFVRVFCLDEARGETIELTGDVNYFQYKYSEEEDNVCTLKMEFEDIKTPDRPIFKDKTQLQILWGYIQGEVSKKVKVYIQQTDWVFSDKSVEVTIQATDKAASLKFDDSNRVYSGVTMATMAKSIADKHGLKAFFETSPKDTDFKDLNFSAPMLPGESLDTYLKRNAGNQAYNPTFDVALDKQQFTTKILIDQTFVNKVEDKSKKNSKASGDAGYKAPTPQTGANKKFMSFIQEQAKQTMLEIRYPELRYYDAIPQANRTDATFLKEQGMKELNGPYIVKGSDDELIIRKRNFKQPHYKGYLYKGDEGSLINFKPCSKNRHKQMNAGNVGYGSWDPLNKTYGYGNANGLNDNDPTLAKFKKIYKFYKKLQDGGKGSAIVDYRKRILPITVDPYADQTLVNKNRLLETPYTVDNVVDALKKAGADYDKKLQNSLYDPTAESMDQAYQNANNLRRKAELQLNPASATIHGDPNLEDGIIISILGVSKKYSGNYYIIEATHTISKDQAYLVEIEAVTQGMNVVNGNDFVQHAGQINRVIGPDIPKKNKKKLKIKKNPS